MTIGRLVLTLMVLAGLPVAAVGAEDKDRIVATPKDNGEALVNPGMGWVLYYYDQHMGRYGSRLEPNDTVDDFPGVSTIYMAIPWTFLEPREGQYDWSIIDTPAQRWIAKGKQIALRFPCCEPFYEYATPQWVEAAGAKFHPFQTTPRSRQWTKDLLGDDIPERCFAPDYSDPVFLRKHANFLAAAAKRYDGNPHVAYIDVGSFGTWGEGHTALSCGRSYDAAVKIRHLEMYRQAFPRTLLVAGDDLLKTNWRDDDKLIERAVALGMALRDDSVLVDSLKRIAESEKMAQSFWPNKPVILEPAHYGQATAWWNTWGDGSPYLESIERYHASYVGAHWWPREFLKENGGLIERANRRMGYRIQLREASWPRSVAAGQAWTFAAKWCNAGVAPCLPGGRAAVTLKDANHGVVAVLTIDGFDARDLPVAAAGEPRIVSHDASVTISPTLKLKPGTYELLISVGGADGTPRIALPHDGGDGSRRYRLGEITVVEGANVGQNQDDKGR